MRTPLDKTLRNTLERTVIQAREVVEQAASDALTRLGVSESSAPSYLKDEERKLRKRLRAHGRALGDVRFADGEQQDSLLIREVAYEHWHRMLFARYLEQNDLLMYDAHTAVTLEECAELAEDEAGFDDGWTYAGHLAQKMLPQIFRTDSPVFSFKLAINHVRTLETLVMGLSPETFQASDSLGWCYQFWQSKRKDEVNASGVKIGARELSPVTQLFTEPYMVSFLLDNALGAWWANKRLTKDDLTQAGSEKDLRQWAAIEGVPLDYLRFVKQENEDGSFAWSPAAGTFEQWPEALSELKTLDPCCGSGHFLVAVFLMLVPMRMTLEGLSATEAIDQVLRQNIHGLELDQRCVELAAFALALEAWRFPDAGGYRVLPELNLACTGLSVKSSQKKDWIAFAENDSNLAIVLDDIYGEFKDAPNLGSLINPQAHLGRNSLFEAKWGEVFPIIEKTLSKENDSSYHEMQVVAQGLSKAAKILDSEYSWVITNVPYRSTNDLTLSLKKHCEANYPEGSSNLATVFTLRIFYFLNHHGIASLVLPQNWLSQPTYKDFRKNLLSNRRILTLARLGPHAFQEISGEEVNVVLITVGLTKTLDTFYTIDCGRTSNFDEKNNIIREKELNRVSQNRQLSNPESVIFLENFSGRSKFLKESASSIQGIKTGDDEQYKKPFWEVEKPNNSPWLFLQSTVKETVFYGGLEYIVNWGADGQHLARRQGLKAWYHSGVAISQMSNLPCAIYMKTAFDSNMTAVVPKLNNQYLPLLNYAFSGDLSINVKKFDQSKKPTNSSFEKVSFDENYWNSHGVFSEIEELPAPYTNDPTQWIYHGHPCGSVIWHDTKKQTAHGDLRQDETVLQTAVARLLGYRWPAETDPEMELAPQMREWVERCSDFEGLTDDDGIVCLDAIRGEKTAHDRLELILQKAYGDQWSATVLHNLLSSVKATDLDTWLRNKFFEQHTKLFQHRPFIWHIWDGLKDGFSALVNYHQFDNKHLERLIYTYLEDWIRQQTIGRNEGVDGAESRLTAARNLKETLESILKGEEGLDIFVRWKPLEEQAIGWNPDLNDGVRLNIRPFMLATDVGKKGAGVLRAKPNIHWKKDRGNDVESAPWYELGLQYDEKVGARINDHHLSLEEKQDARAKLKP